MTESNAKQQERIAMAELLFSDVDRTTTDILRHYPARPLDETALVTRFGPSPTGFTHIGGIMTSLLNKKLAEQTGGVFILRIEDTDRQREIKDGSGMIVRSLNRMGLAPDEGPIDDVTLEEAGNYGPYTQSRRQDIYHAFAKQLVCDGHAYPCFMTPEELEDIRSQQQEHKLRPGVYGEWARYRTASIDQVRQKLGSGEKFVLRLKPTYTETDRKIRYKDRARGKLELPENTLDTVLIKSDGFPTYHFAHPIDDALMGVNLIIRGDEWISTTPIHFQLFEFLRLPRPDIAHIAPIAKLDGSSRRKLSKRKDDEASMDYYHEAGYEPLALIEYLMNLLDSGFENWRKANPDLPWKEFELSIGNLGKSSSLFDLDKLNNIARDVMVRMSSATRYDHAQRWADRYAPDFAKTLSADPEYSARVLSIGVHDEKPRKDLAHWSEVESVYGYFYSDVFNQRGESGFADMPEIDRDAKLAVLSFAVDQCDSFTAGDKEAFLNETREFAGANQFALKNKDFKQEPTAYKGTWGDILMLLRVAVTGRKRTPDLHEVMQLLGSEEVAVRLRQAIDAISDL